MITKLFSIALLTIALSTQPLRAADASFKHWRSSMKAAEEVRFKRNFEQMREILEASAPEAQQLGPASSAENTYWLSVAYEQLGQNDLALKAFDAELQRIGPNPTAVKLQILRGTLLGERGRIYYRLGDLDKALASALEGRRVLENVGGKFHPELFDIYMTIGRIHAYRKEFAAAEESMKTALRLAQVQQSGSGRRWSGPEEQTVIFILAPAPYRIILAGSELGDLLRLEKKFDEAEGPYKTAMESARAAYPKDSVMQLLPVRGLAEVELRKGRRKEFLKDTDAVYELMIKNHGLEPASTYPLWLKFGLDLDEKKESEAAETAKKIAKVYEFQSFDFSPFAQKALSLGVHDSEVDWSRAEAAQRALTKLAESYRSTDPGKAGRIYIEIANFASAHGKPELTERMLEQAVNSQQNAPDKSLLIGLFGKLAENKLAAGSKAEALEYYHKVSLAMQEKYGNDMRVADAMDTEASVMKDLGQDQAAKELRTKAMDLRGKTVLK